MKINYKNTALKFLEYPKDMAIHTPDGYSKPLTKAEDYKLLYGLQEQFSQDGFADYFNKNIQYITQPFYEAYRKAEYADVESKVINAQKKEHHVGVKYLNETNRKIEILDSTYFTTISRTEGFGVRGHFRFQPYGIDMKERRLQWINEYQKTGYTKRAKILSQ